MGRRWTAWGLMLLALAGLVLASGQIGGAAQALALRQQRTSDPWQSYQNTGFGYNIDYPSGWKAQVAFENPPGEPYIIRQRVAFRSAEFAQVEIDVWDRDPGIPMEQWFREVEQINSPVEINAVLSGQDAYLRIEPGGCGVPTGYAAYVPIGAKVYKIAHANSGDLASLVAYDGMLRSFELWAADASARTQTILPDYLPAAPLTCSTNVCPSTCWYGCTFAAISQGCCGYHPISKWQCARECVGDQPGAFEGNCVWWGAYTRRDVGELASGNAEDWAVSVRNTGQLPVDRTPKVGDTVVHPGTSYNHVAYVVWVSADGTEYMMSDMGWCGDCGPTPDELKLRTVDEDDEFIHCAGDPAIPTTDWAFADCPFGWTPSKGFSASELDGFAWGFNPAVDPFLLSPVLSVVASDYNNVEVRIFSHAADTMGKIYFTTSSSPAFDEAKSVEFAVINDGAWHDIRVHMSSNPYWQGTITRLRVDPVGNGNVDGSYDGIGIDRIRFLLFYPVLSEGVYVPLVMRAVGQDDNQPPHVPADPWPADGAVDQLLPLTLTWTGSDPDGDEVSYDVYLDVGETSPQTLVCDDTATPACDPGALLNDTEYSWQVIATDDRGASTAGPVWGLRTAPAGCVDVVANGGFELSSDWYLPATAYPARYSTAQARNGSRSMQVGIVDTAEDKYSYSSAQQVVSIPAGVGSATLRFWLYTVSEEPEVQASPPASSAPQALLADDSQYVRIYNESGDVLLRRLWSGVLDDRAWAPLGSYDLLAYAGQTVRLYFGVVNDGDGAPTGMYVDEVTLVVCPP